MNIFYTHVNCINKSNHKPTSNEIKEWTEGQIETKRWTDRETERRSDGVTE